MEGTTQSNASRNTKLASMHWSRFDDPELESAFSTWRADFHIYASIWIMSVNLFLVLAGAMIDIQDIPAAEASRLLPYRISCATGLFFLIIFLHRRASPKDSTASPRLVTSIHLIGVSWGLCFYSLVARTYTIHTGHNDSMIIVPAFAFLTLVFLPRTKYCVLLAVAIFHFAMAFIHNLAEVPAWLARQHSFSLFIFVLAGIVGHYWRNSTERRLFEYAWRERSLGQWMESAPEEHFKTVN